MLRRHLALLLAGGLAVGSVATTASAAAVAIVSYDVSQTPGSGFGCWFHNYTGAIVDTGHTVSGSVICTPDGGHVFDYSGGSGTLNDGLVDTTHLLLTRTDDQGQDLQPVITLHLERVVTVNQIRLLKGDNSFTCLTGAAVEINGTTVSFPNPSPIGGDCRSVALDLGPTALGGVPTDLITVKGFSASFFGSPIDQFGIGEIEVDGTEVGPTESATITSGRAYTSDRPGRGFFRLGGEFSSSAPLDLGALGITATLTAALDEDNHGELVGGLPVALFPRTRSARVTVFERPAGATPFYRLTVRTCIPTQEGCPNTRGIGVGEYEFLLEGVGPTIASPTECGPPPGPGMTVITGLFTINDGINPPVGVLYDSPWRCQFQKGQVTIIRTP